MEYDKTPEELQEWCNKHPDYPAFKKECIERKMKVCEEIRQKISAGTVSEVEKEIYESLQEYLKLEGVI